MRLVRTIVHVNLRSLADYMRSAKHYIGNEQEHFRQPYEWGLPNALSANIDDRTLHVQTHSLDRLLRHRKLELEVADDGEEERLHPAQPEPKC